MTQFCAQAQLTEHIKTKQRQVGKFDNLSARKVCTSNGNKERLSSECIAKWVKNCSKRILTDPELSVLAKGLNYAVSPKELPVVDVITATEVGCRNLTPDKASELRAKVNTVLTNTKKVEHNLNKDEFKALDDLRKDKSIKILPADKGRCAVILDTEEYVQKCNALLDDTNTYSKLKRDPTQKYKKQLIELLKQLKGKGSLDDSLYRRLYPTTDTPPKFYGLPKIHKQNNPLRPIVSSIGSISYNCAKYIAEILNPIVGKTEHHIKNSQQFADIIKHYRVEDDEELRSYDVSALFTSVPVDNALEIIKNKLANDNTLADRTKLTPEDVTILLEFCLKCTYFVYNDQYYLQVHGAAMGSPVSPIVCNLYMEDLEARALATAEHPPGWWFRYVDDTHTKQKKAHIDSFSDHINSLDPHIKFTSEPEENGALAFLDTLTVRQPDGSLKVKIYRKPTHTDQYLNFQSNQPLEHKLGVIRTLHHRANTVITDELDKTEEKQHINKALRNCGYPKWAIDKAVKPKATRDNSATDRNTPLNTPRTFIAIPYVKGISEKLKRIYNSYGICAHVKPVNTIRQSLCAPKDKTKKGDICGPIYHIECGGLTGTDCKESYIGETERNLKTRFLEHRRPSSTTSEVAKHIHIESPGHKVDLEKVKILDREDNWFSRGVKESIYIRALKPSLNRDGGRHNLPHIWDNVIRSRSTSRDLSQ